MKIQSKFPFTLQLPVLAFLLFSAIVPMSAYGQVNYDTAWTVVYDGGKYKNGNPVYDDFYDVKSLPDGGVICTGGGGDTSSAEGQIHLFKINSSGAIAWKKLYKHTRTQYAHCIGITKNGDFIIGGKRYGGPVIMRTDSLGNLKWSAWYYDSLNGTSLLSRSVPINSIRETSTGKIICAAGDDYPDNGGNALNNYGVYLEYDSTGKFTNGNQFTGIVGYNIGGFYIEEALNGNYLISGNQAVFCFNNQTMNVWRRSYGFSLNEVGTVTNKVKRAKMTRSGTLIVAGQAYEGNCWTRYKKYYWDAWWSPISMTTGLNTTWDTAGTQGGDDVLNDFAQLSNGNLVFVGSKASGAGGIWAFVTDSIGKNLLWEKQFPIAYKTEMPSSPVPLAVCATPDSGFTVVGKYSCTVPNGAMNAFVAHFIPAAPIGIQQKEIQAIKSSSIKVLINKGSLQFVMPDNKTQILAVSIYNASGKLVKMQNQLSVNKNIAECNITNMGNGVYFYKLATVNKTFSGKIIK